MADKVRCSAIDAGMYGDATNPAVPSIVLDRAVSRWLQSLSS
jgi:hypothetical protein